MYLCTCARAVVVCKVFYHEPRQRRAEVRTKHECCPSSGGFEKIEGRESGSRKLERIRELVRIPVGGEVGVLLEVTIDREKKSPDLGRARNEMCSLDRQMNINTHVFHNFTPWS